MLNIKLELPEGFLEEEERDGYLVSAEMKKIWAVELDLLNEFMRVCKEHDIRWFADGGTILGAIRHNGMIPWDDDIDVCMYREDYEKLLDSCKLAIMQINGNEENGLPAFVADIFSSPIEKIGFLDLKGFFGGLNSSTMLSSFSFSSSFKKSEIRISPTPPHTQTCGPQIAALPRQSE